ncbi:PiggyBac transposable element-derived protein 4 [Elysia marginata]|uniref:PiggyBac transposable element-derived protein 4 n=1 Tax=Elysia marginata TaxID=1093978 RepID=A0AAV4FLE3_9GAST|nr:PiggyBac transposable element-derived protein 4 [Elysia marginata]
MVVGTVCANRIGLPRDFMAQPLTTGDMDYCRKNQVAVIRWKDKREVNVLSTKYHAHTRDGGAQNANGSKEKKLAFHMLSLTLVQAHILRNKFLSAPGKRRWQLCDFAKDVCLSLVTRGGWLNEAQEGGDLVDRLLGKYFLVPIDMENSSATLAVYRCSARCYASFSRQIRLLFQSQHPFVHPTLF